MFAARLRLYGLWLINYRAILTPIEGVNEFTAGGETGEKTNGFFFYTSWSGFKSDLINTMDHMRISGTDPSSLFLSRTK